MTWLKRRLWVLSLLGLLCAACDQNDAADAGDTDTGKPAGSGSEKADAWDPTNNPARVSWDYISDFYKLKLTAKTSKTPWSDDYWAFYNGGIAYRWQQEQTPWQYGASPTLDQLRDWSTSNPSKIATLSPAEKYDIYTGDYTYPTVAEMKNICSPDSQGWEGFCDGWSNAAIHYAEPNPVTLTGANGIRIPFASSDIKALLTYFQSRKAVLNRVKIGEPCFYDLNAQPGMGTQPQCNDTNPGSLHLMLANWIGERNQAFVGDVTRDQETWNQPFYSYSSKVEKVQACTAGASPECVKEVVLTTVVTYVVEVYPHQTPRHADRTANYQYRLELNANNEIVGGSWISNDRPDFTWFNPKTEFYGYFEKLGEIYAAATGSN